MRAENVLAQTMPSADSFGRSQTCTPCAGFLMLNRMLSRLTKSVCELAVEMRIAGSIQLDLLIIARGSWSGPPLGAVKVAKRLSRGIKQCCSCFLKAKPLKIKNYAAHEGGSGHGVARDYFVFLPQDVFGIDVNGQPFQYVHAQAGVP